MSSERALVNIISSIALSLDGAVLGVALAYGAVCSLLKFTSYSSSLRRLSDAPSLPVSDLLPQHQNTLLVVRGTVDRASPNNLLTSHHTREKAVIVHRTLTCINNEWKGLLGWTSDLRALFLTRRREESSSFRQVPFVLIDGNERLIVNMDGSKHPLPLITSYHKLEPVSPSPYTFLQTVFGHEYPVGLLDEEKILPIGKDLNVVGICRIKNGIPQIKSCKELPYFLSEQSKDEMIVDLDFKTKTLLFVGISLGCMSIGVLGYAVVRNWNKWKEWRQQRRDQQVNQAAAVAGDADSEAADADDESGDIPEGQLCVICLTRRKTSAFLPCGHMVCCHRCALLVEREVTPSCPVCRQTIRNSLRIYGS